MPERARANCSCPVWWWMLPILLLASALAVVWLDVNALNGDEPKSVIAAGVFRSGPHSFQDVWNTIASMSPEQALGWPMLLSLWGRVTGWSEYAVRVIPMLAGIVTLAWVYRTGRDFFNARAGLYAALLLGVSVFLHAYMAHARAFTLVALFSTLCLWCYWRVALHPRPSGWATRAGLLLGATGLLWSHYFSALLLPVLGLYHLLFAQKTRRWWWPVLLIGLAGLTATLQLPVFAMGLDRTVTNLGLHNRAMSAPDLLARLLHHLGNGAVYPRAPFDDALFILLPPGLLTAFVLRLRAGERAGAAWYPGLVSGAFLLLVIAVNEVVQAMGVSRVRYLMPLWPMLALPAGAGLERLARRRRWLVLGLLTLWLIAGVRVSLDPDFRYRLGFFRRTDFHEVYRTMRERITPADFLAVDYHAAQGDPSRIYLRTLNVPWATIHRYLAEPYEEVTPEHEEFRYLWLLYLTKDRVGFTDLYSRLGRVLCERALDEWGFTLERYARHSAADCPEVPARLDFEADISMTAPEIEVRDGRLRLDAHFRSADHALLARYTLAVHIIDPRSGERVTQGDTGVGPGNIVPLRSEIDVSALPAGEYELRVALYDWQTGERLPARDLATGASGDMLTLQHFRVG